MPEEFGKFKSSLEIAKGKKIAPQSESIDDATSSVLVKELRRDSQDETYLEATVDELDFDLGNPDHPRFLFLAMESETYQADICGKKRNAIRYRIKKSETEYSKWQWLDGPKVLINQPGLSLDVKGISFEGNIELVDQNDELDEQKVKIFITIGKGPDLEKVNLHFVETEYAPTEEDEQVLEEAATAN